MPEAMGEGRYTRSCLKCTRPVCSYDNIAHRASHLSRLLKYLRVWRTSSTAGWSGLSVFKPTLGMTKMGCGPSIPPGREE